MAETGTALTRADSTAWAIACNREPVIRALAEMPRVSRRDILDASARLGLGRTRIYQLIARFRANPVTSSLLDHQEGCPKGTQRLAPEIEQVIAAEIECSFLKRPKPNVAQLCRNIRLAAQAKSLPPPTRKAITQRLALLDQKQVVHARDGAKAAADRFRPVVQSYVAEYPLQVVQMDHTSADIIIVDEHYRKPLARPTLSLMVDINSRVIPGYYLSLEHPSTTSVGMTMRHAVLPKTEWLEQRGICLDYPVWGIPDCLHLDNAKEFHSRPLSRGCREHGVELMYRPKKTPHYGGHIERLIGTMIGEVHLLPGTTFSNIAEKGDYDAEGQSCMTLREFEHWFALQIGVYHQTRHSALGVPPMVAWADGLSKRPSPLRLPVDPATFLLDFLPFEMRKVRREGIALFHTFYWHGGLAKLIDKRLAKLPVKYNPLNLSVVYLELPEGGHLTVPMRDRRRPAITKFEHDQAVRQLRERGRREIDEQLIFDLVAEQRRIVLDAIAKTKSARKHGQRVAYALEAGFPAPSSASPMQLIEPPPRPNPQDDADALPITPFEIAERL